MPNLGGIAGVLGGGAAGFLTAKKYEAGLTALFGSLGAYALPIAAGAIGIGYAGKRLYKSKSQYS